MYKVLFIILLSTLLLAGEHVRIASYNVENLFDLRHSGSEYHEYIPNTSWKWNRTNYHKKLKNIAKVIHDMQCDIISIQEIESYTALKDLQKELKKKGSYFPHISITSKKKTSVQIALLSKFPIISTKELSVTSSRKYRNILENKIKIGSQYLYLFSNHWKAKSGAESQRIISAKVLRHRLNRLGYQQQILLLGDFNSHYEEYILFKKKRKHNNTNGITGINHILQTTVENKPTTLATLSTCKTCTYNLWYEIDKKRRWTHKYRSSKEALDSIIITKGLADKRGIEYIKNSFERFEPDYLFKYNAPYRWQRSRTYPKHHTGKGFSDHLPIYADFKIIDTK
jgi:endonuclease/exonuclease/phosphatase family metal-dependent hydrolase